MDTLGRMGNNSWTIDTSRMPLVVTTFGRRLRDDADVREMIAKGDELFKSRSKLFHVIDLRQMVEPANAVQRKIMADWHKQVKATNANACIVATAIVVESTIVRGAMTAVLWLSSSSAERTEVFPNPETAIRWLHRVSQEMSLPFPSDAVTNV